MCLIQLQEMLTYPNRHWDATPSVRWESLCTQMQSYEAPPRSMILPKERKWELVSALQKSIRRADKQIALRLVSAIDNMPEEYGYFWRRLCVTACEDIGPADD
jgi:replication-associated recombination protein RarA